MRTSQLLKRGLIYYWRTNIAVVLGVATAVAVLSGALLVGDSVRTSLRNLVVQRLEQTSFAIASSGFVREELASDLQSDPQFPAKGFTATCPLISLEGTVTHEPSKRVASGINIYGVDERFWKFNQRNGTAPQNRNALISRTLASELGTGTGDAILLRIALPSDIPLESLHSKKQELGKTLRISVGEVAGAEGLGDFSLQPQQAGVRAIFVSLKLLQSELSQPNRVNLMLISDAQNGLPSEKTSLLGKILRERLAIEDLGIQLRPIALDDQVAISLEHDSMLIEDSLGKIAGDVANDLSLRHTLVFSYLANSITFGDRAIPYSLVTALDQQAFTQLNPTSPATSVDAQVPPIILNEWAADDLGVRQGDQIAMEYYLWHEGGRLETKTAKFQVVGVVPIQGLAADRNLVPEYPGISGSENLADWDPPFPVDLQRVRQKDEDYWHQYKTTPKAFIPLQAGQSLWQTRFGKVTSVRFWPASGRADETLRLIEEKLLAAVNPALMGVAVLPVRSQSLEASRGATDFGEYFVYFSFFVVVSALLLTTLFFKLGVEQRIREIGLLRAIGFGPGEIRKLFLIEGIILAVIGSLIGLIGAVAYGQLMMFGLRTWWVDAVGTTALKLHVSPQSLLFGAVGGIIAALVCVALTLRSLGKQSTRSLLAGMIASSASSVTTGRMRQVTSFRIGTLLTVAGLVLLIAAAIRSIGQVGGFFGGGALLLGAFLFYQASWLRRRDRKSVAGTGWWPIARLGFRNTSYRPGRSILSIALIASAVFIIVAVDSFRHRGGAPTNEPKSSTGGFPLLADSLLPIVNDPNSGEGQEALNLIGENPDSPLKGIAFTRFRVQPGDDASCLNLYQPQNPKILAPTSDFINSNRFNFQSSLATSIAEIANPWLLLNREFSDGAVPVIADANSLAYVLHLKLGDDMVIQHGDKPLRLRVVAALADSLFQSELLISEPNFLHLFPEQQGYRFFLIDLPNTGLSADVTAALEDRLADFGFDVRPTAERLATFHRVENTYLSTFQMLGGLGLILGTIGLSAILLRNVLERRRELALMRAVGYDARHFTLMIIAENTLLLFGGVITGTICALLAIAPVFLARQGRFLNVSLGLLLLAVLVSGFIASLIGTWATLRAPLLKALRAE